MANREENLKKINNELEMLSDDELEQVAGGGISDTAKDSKFLHDYGLMDEHYTDWSLMFSWKSKSAAVDAGWSKAGITSVTKPIFGNKYFAGDREISREEAIRIVKSKFKRIHSFSDE